jgi:hypothetical protein
MYERNFYYSIVTVLLSGLKMTNSPSPFFRFQIDLFSILNRDITALPLPLWLESRRQQGSKIKSNESTSLFELSFPDFRVEVCSIE